MVLRWLGVIVALALSGCAASTQPAPQSPALFTTWGVQPYEVRPDGLLINGLTPVDPEEHF